MTDRRHAHTYATPAVETIRADEPQPACLGNSLPFDLLHDYISGPEFRAARREALALCNACPLQAACWTENRDEVWVVALVNGEARNRKRKPPTTTARCGSPAGARAHYRRDERACDACKRADYAATRAWKARRRAERKEAAA